MSDPKRAAALAIMTELAVEALRSRLAFAGIDGDLTVTLSADELEAITDRLEELAGIARAYHDRIPPPPTTATMP